MKLLFLCFLIFLTIKTSSQTINYCEYFALDVSEIDFKGKKEKSYSPTLLASKKDKFQKFINKHQLRFDYILFKNSDLYKDIVNFNPDIKKIANEFCSNVIHSNAVNSYLRSLTPKSMTNWNIKRDTFSVDELMDVASKFFYCDGISKKDTLIQSHICVGINGTNDLQSKKDLTLLEAFSIEAIFECINGKNKPQFYTDFFTYKKRVSEEQRKTFKDFDSHLKLIRNLCYERMKNNEDLKRKLLGYYHKNRNNLNFLIQ